MIYEEEKEGYFVDDDGFCEESDYSTHISNLFSLEFNFARQVNKECYELFKQLQLHSGDPIGRFMASSFNKIHKTFQSIIILSSRGLEEESKIMMRTMLDKLFISKAILNDKNNYEKWVLSQDNKRRILINLIKEKAKGLEDIKWEDYETEIDKGKNTSVREWAQLADMEADYNRYYRLFSGDVHISAALVDSDYGIDSDGKHMDIGPRYEDTGAIIITACKFMIEEMYIFAKKFDIRKDKIDDLVVQFDEISIKYES